MDKERQIDEIVKIICPVYKDGAKCTFNERLFGERKCANPCVKRTEAKQLINAGYRLTVHGEWNKTRKGMKCTRCGCLSSLFDKQLEIDLLPMVRRNNGRRCGQWLKTWNTLIGTNLYPK